jgi:hypothetical protein
MDKTVQGIHLGDLPRPESQQTLTMLNGDINATRPPTSDEEAAYHTDRKGDYLGSSSPTEDRNAVGWDGLDDPHNPLNWSDKKKWSNILAVSLMAVLT